MIYKTTITQISLHAAEDSPTCGESAVLIGIDDHGGGPFLTIENPIPSQEDKMRVEIDLQQWPLVAAAVEKIQEGLEDD